MAYSPFDSPLFKSLLGDPDVAALFTDSAQIRAMLLVEGALANAQGQLGLIPVDSAAYIQRAAMEVQIDPADLALGLGKSGVVVPGLVAAFQSALNAPEHARYVHFGATSQDIVDTALMLRLRQFTTLLDGRLSALIDRLTEQAIANRDVVMAARTRGQIATPTTFGARIANWQSPLLRNHQALKAQSQDMFCVSLAGASGNAAAFGDYAAALTTKVAELLNLTPAPMPWHTARDRITDYSARLGNITMSCGKIGKDILQMTQSEVRELSLASTGGSSTMPHKSNPVIAELVVALADYVAAQMPAMFGAQMAQEERDGSAWLVEWLTLPQICIASLVAVTHTQNLVANMTANPTRMMETINAMQGLMFAEAATFALSQHISRTEAKALVSAACDQVMNENRHLRSILEETCHVAIDWDPVFDPAKQTGNAQAIVDALRPRDL